MSQRVQSCCCRSRAANDKSNHRQHSQHKQTGAGERNSHHSDSIIAVAMGKAVDGLLVD